MRGFVSQHIIPVVTVSLGNVQVLLDSIFTISTIKEDYVNFISIQTSQYLYV